MTVDRWVRAIAGAFVMASVVLAVTVNLNWLFFTAFVGLNLFQYGFTNVCPLGWILKKLGVPESKVACA
jgi:hypothetical protein